MGAYNRRRVGAEYEQAAAAYLQARGLSVIEQNYRNRSGEIDLIARDGDYLVFVEVKYRKSGGSGDPAEAVDARKQQKIRSVARYYLYSRGYGEDTLCRFDVVAVLGSEIRWIRDAF